MCCVLLFFCCFFFNITIASLLTVKELRGARARVCIFGGGGWVVWWSQLVASGLWKPSWWTEHGGLTSVPEHERCAFHWISHKDVLLWSLLRLKAEGIWVALCTAFACPVMKYYSPFMRKPFWKDMEMNQTGLILDRISWHKTKGFIHVG